ncbi:ABC transporter ATP-binding protein [Cellulomonas xiejunii]|uniref:ABC transporter ATP-binding protein n=1 Tax=Cellulomonas xiejunii TaxID=2968083 RepID=UPI001D0EE41A|nr:ATP-binding cassette domain-containing protein [Cellulomonas xiejunii]MCC2314743.1 ATP-binding cassette domain-containing protein [Cellulomonas xiejunii]
MPAERAARLRVRGLHVALGPDHVLRGVDLDLDPGDLHVVLGPSGAGKSMLLRALTGTLPRGSRVAGDVRVLGAGGSVDVLRADRAALHRVHGRVIGVVPQAAATSFTPVRTLRAQLAEVVQALGPPRARLLPGHPHLAPVTPDAHLADLVATAGLDPALLDRYPHELSGGQVRRAAVAAALVGHPPVVLADEPSSGLDEDAAAVLAQMLRAYAHAGHATLLVTHDVEIAQAFGDTLDVLVHGEVVEHGPARRVLGSPQAPLTRELVTARRPGGLPSPAVSPETPPVLRLRDVRAGYGTHVVLDGVDLDVRPGEVVGVAGRSGAGKSTLAAVAALMHRPDAGRVEVDGVAVRGTGWRAPAAVRRRVGWVQQEPRQAMDPRLTLRRSLTLPQQAAGRDDLEPVEELARAVGLDLALLDRRPSHVSGGELQRAAIARALALRPALLVCDEITAMLDAVSAARLGALVARLAVARGIGVLLVSHDRTLLRASAHRVVHVDGGRLVPAQDEAVAR